MLNSDDYKELVEFFDSECQQMLRERVERISLEPTLQSGRKIQFREFSPLPIKSSAK